VVEVPQFPIPSIVAVFAPGTQLSTVGVAAFMAGIAVCGGFVPIESPLVTTVAGHHPMLAEQRIFGVPIMIERWRFPLLLRMAFLAFLTKTGVMDVILFVAGITVRRRLVSIERALVTTLAFCSSMVSL
jgi:hypothetical protein